MSKLSYVITTFNLHTRVCAPVNSYFTPRARAGPPAPRLRPAPFYKVSVCLSVCLSRPDSPGHTPHSSCYVEPRAALLSCWRRAIPMNSSSVHTSAPDRRAASSFLLPGRTPATSTSHRLEAWLGTLAPAAHARPSASRRVSWSVPVNAMRKLVREACLDARAAAAAGGA